MDMKKIIITIDGWSSCGKSTLAKQLAKTLNYVYVDSGAMYRAITLYFLRNHVDFFHWKQIQGRYFLALLKLLFYLSSQHGYAESIR